MESLEQPLFDSNSRPKRSRVRWQMLAMSFFGITCAYITRLNLSLAIVAMVKPPHKTNIHPDNHLNHTILDSGQQSSSPSSSSPDLEWPPRYDWDSTSQALILGSFFYTYGLLQVPGARWCERFGAKWPCFVITLGCGLISVLLPLAATMGVWAVVCLRATLGLCQSAVYPAYYALLVRWLPEQEQSTGLGMLANGGFSGAILAMLLTGFFCEHRWMGGWPAVFYTCAFVCFVWCVIWAIYASDEPSSHPFISEMELRYIQRNKRLPHTGISGGGNLHNSLLNNPSSINNVSGETVPSNVVDNDQYTPWMAIMTSRQVWAVIVAKFGVDWLFWLLMLNLPLYLNHVLHVRMHQNGLINSALNAMLIVSNGLAGMMADNFVARKIAPKTLIRKYFQSAAVVGSCVCVLLVPVFQQTSPSIVITLFLLLMLAFGLNIGGDIPIVIDMTEQYPATIFAIANSICSACGFIVPLISASILDSQVDDPARWTFIFLTAVLVNIGCLAFFLQYGSSEPLFRTRVYRFDSERLLNSDASDTELDSGDEKGLISKRRLRPF